MKNLNYSFIIPHKNCPDLLSRCIESIPQREDVQIIVIDDNSDVDKKPQVERQGAEVVLLDAEHSKGAGRARNVGLEHAKGKWLLFADADDYYTEQLPILLDKYADDESTDIVYLNACMFDETDNVLPYRSNGLIRDYLSGKKNAVMNLKYCLWTPWTRMVKKEIVTKHNISFDEIPAGNDVMFGLNCSRYAELIEVESDIIYKYFKSSRGSVTDKARRYMIEDRLDLLGREMKFYKEVGYNTKSSFINEIVRHIYRKNLNIREAIGIYETFLNKYEISVFSDMSNFITSGKLCSLMSDFVVRKFKM